MKTIIRNIISPAILIVICLFLDLLCGWPFFGVAVVVAMFVFTGYMGAIKVFRKREVDWRGHIFSYKNLIAVLLLVASIGVFWLNRWYGRSTRSIVLSAICGFRLDNKRYPDDIQELVPKYLVKVPRPKLIWIMPGNEYSILRCGGGDNLLVINEGHFEPDSVKLDEKVCSEMDSQGSQ